MLSTCIRTPLSLSRSHFLFLSPLASSAAWLSSDFSLSLYLSLSLQLVHPNVVRCARRAAVLRGEFHARARARIVCCAAARFSFGGEARCSASVICMYRSIAVNDESEERCTSGGEGGRDGGGDGEKGSKTRALIVNEKEHTTDRTSVVKASKDCDNNN